MRRFKVPKQKLRKVGDRGTESTVCSARNSRAKCVCGHATGISWWWPWCVVFVTAAVRIRYVTLPENWWILHPDEIFQSIEVAFSEVYGYGFRPYEYLPAPENTSIPAEAQILQSGMYGLRSPIYPKIFSIVLSIAKLIGLEQNPFMVCRVFQAAFVSLLPVTVYWFALKLFHCRLLAFLTCALCAVERHLAVFGTHTIVNSFISPMVFSGLTVCLQVNESAEESQENGSTDTGTDQNANTISKHLIDNGLYSYKQLKQNKPLKNGISITEKNDSFSTHGNNVKRHWLVAKIVFSTKGTIFFKKLFSGFVLGVVCYVRPDTALFCIVVILPVLYSKQLLERQHVKELAVPAIGGAAAFMYCVANDWLWYGWGTISPVQWFKFNILSGRASKLFGTENAGVYLNVFVRGVDGVAVNLTLVAILIYSSLKQSECLLLPRVLLAICLSFTSNIIMFSYAGHKENRFIHNTIILYILIISYGLHTVASVLRKHFPKKNYSSLISSGFFIAFTLFSYNHYPSRSSLSISEWTYGDARTSAEINTCLDWLRRQNDINGVYIDASLYDMAGFIILKHDVPLLVKMHYEYYIFGAGVTNKQNHRKRLKVTHDYNDFIHQSNKVYITKVISRDKRFNYAITGSDVFSLVNSNYSFEKVFTYGQYNIFYRNFSSSQERDLEKLSGSLPVGDNATVLEYEANWLITNALYHLAIERTEMAMKLDRSRVRLYQQMFVCYSKLNDTSLLYHYQEECFRKFGREACVRQYEKIVLHEYYSTFDYRK